MLMTRQDREEIRQLLLDVISSHTAEVDGKFNVIHEKLERIEAQTTKTNGRVNKLEEKTEILKINDIEHITHCPNSEKIQLLMNSETKRIGIYKFVTIVAGVCATLATLVISYLELKKLK